MKITMMQYKLIDNLFRSKQRYKVITWSTINKVSSSEDGLKRLDKNLTILMTNVEEMQGVKEWLIRTSQHVDLIPVIEILINRHKVMAFELVQIGETIREHLRATGVLDKNEVPF